MLALLFSALIGGAYVHYSINVPVRCMYQSSERKWRLSAEKVEIHVNLQCIKLLVSRIVSVAECFCSHISCGPNQILKH